MTESADVLLHFEKNNALNATIQLTGSKSECNRALILAALSKGVVKVANLSEAADTVTLQQVLQHQIQAGTEINIGPAGTAMRFLTAFLANQEGEYVLTGSERMQQRPIGILVKALNDLGAQITYEHKEGFPPLKIKGPLAQKTTDISVKGDVSSQYLSALLLSAPTLPMGLHLHIEGNLTSKPYLEMTLAMLKQTGIAHQWKENSIYIAPQTFQASSITVEPDWSAASYWYSIVALQENSCICLPYLKKDSLQGDHKIAEIMAHFGVETTYQEEGIVLKNIGKRCTQTHFDFIECPDLAQTVVVCAAALGYDLSFSGLHTLRIKETDRILALQQELAKINVQLIEDNDIFTLQCADKNIPAKLKIVTYEDHRMAMAFAPLAMICPEVTIAEAKVVEKSYPNFWNDLKKIGFSID